MPVSELLIRLNSWLQYRQNLTLTVEAAAYYFRSRSHNNLRQTLPFLIQNLFILASPPFLAASLYMSPRRIARTIDSEDKVVSPRVLTKLFVIVDITCFVTQVAGAIMSGSDNQNQAQQGKTVILVGLIIQILAFAFFLAWTAKFHSRAKNSSFDSASQDNLSWQRPLYGLYAIGVLFIVRNIVRIIEFKQGSHGSMQTSEVYLYIFDASVMLIIVIRFLVLHPGRLRMKLRKMKKRGYLKDRI